MAVEKDGINVAIVNKHETKEVKDEVNGGKVNSNENIKDEQKEAEVETNENSVTEILDENQKATTNNFKECDNDDGKLEELLSCDQCDFDCENMKMHYSKNVHDIILKTLYQIQLKKKKATISLNVIYVITPRIPLVASMSMDSQYMDYLIAKNVNLVRLMKIS